MTKINMKQHITTEQLNELSKPSKKKLMNSIDNIFHLNAQKQFTGVVTTHWHEDKNYLLSIGQMIEFLINETNFNLDYSGLDNTWGVIIGEQEKGSRELCDALWEAVKEVLETD